MLSIYMEHVFRNPQIIKNLFVFFCYVEDYANETENSIARKIL